MKDDIVRDNKERYDELNPYLTPKAKVLWGGSCRCHRGRRRRCRRLGLKRCSARRNRSNSVTQKSGFHSIAGIRSMAREIAG